jgi:uncharacterized damage-inducible protein DinB
LIVDWSAAINQQSTINNQQSTILPMESWLSGPVPDVPPLLQPVAHMLLHTKDDARVALEGLTPEQIWSRPGGGASVGYHIRHLIGALDRLLTYGLGGALDPQQMAYLKKEAEPGDPPADAATLVAEVDAAVARALELLRETDEATLLEPRAVGRKQLPTTVLGLLAHAGEHSARHAGQAITLRKVLP